MEGLTGDDIYHWCQRKGVNPRKCIGVGGELTETSDDTVLRKVSTLYGVIRPNIVDNWDDEAGRKIAVLVETDKELDVNLIPLMIIADEETGRIWSIIGPNIREENITSIPISAVISPEGVDKGEASGNGHTATNVNGGQFETMVDRVVSQLERWHYEGSYRRLRIFSGIVPVPTGEEPYESWKEAAVQQAEEWQCPDKIKRQRVVESLRGPAMGIIQAARRSNPNANLETYLEALDYAYGTMEDVGDLLSRLHHTFQEPSEKLSAYVIRIDKLLYKIVEKKGITRDEVDKSRMRQVLRGALTTDPVAQKLRCSEKKEPPPGFNEILKEIKQEEVLIEMREKTVKKVKVVQTVTETSPLEEKILKLIEEQNKRIEQFIANQSTNNLSQSTPSSDSTRGGGRRGTFNSMGCFRCGRIGHRAFECKLNWKSPRRYVTPSLNTDGEYQDQGNGQGRPVNPPQVS
ncbi:paraneoplastic antigen Ma2 homolog [Pseudophryne corroboree]|uniref:paraneoplastic antigen Ma2 homolog n=1 Tax=Pseudophryne corroboree TaxID=495146 RepID=UPI0030821B80